MRCPDRVAHYACPECQIDLLREDLVMLEQRAIQERALDGWPSVGVMAHIRRLRGEIDRLEQMIAEEGGVE